MKINFKPNVNFKGTFYTTSDSHTRLSMAAGLMTEIEKRIQNAKEPAFFIDGGDFMGETYPLDVMTQFYTECKKRNPDVKFIFNLGNVELDLFANGKEDAFKAIDVMTKGGIEVVNATYSEVAKNLIFSKHNIKPYTIVEDITEGKKQKIFITGFTEFNATDSPYGVADCKKQLKDVILPSIKDAKPDKVVLMMHTYQNFTKEILKYAKDDLGIDNIELVIGGHPHAIEDFECDNTRVLYHPQNSKAAYEIQHTKQGFQFDKIYPKKNHYNYTPLLDDASVISNLDISSPLPIAQAYNKILRQPSLNKLNETISSNPVYLKARDEYDFKYSSPSVLGTFMANSVKEYAGSDIGILLSMDFRERFPKTGMPITYYHLSDTINVEKPIYKVEGVNTEVLKKILESSLKDQNEGESNRNFLEYSDNLKIERFLDTDKESEKVKQIFIKEDGNWINLLDENQKPVDSEKVFSIATCKPLALGQRSGLEMFKQLQSQEIRGINNKQIIALKLKELEKSGKTSYENSIMIDVEKIEN